MFTHLLRVDASASDNATSRVLGDRLLDRLRAQYPAINLVCRDLCDGVPLLSPEQLVARNIAPAAQTPQQQKLLQPSDTLIAELKAADILLLPTPIYNFSVPGMLKAYIDQVCRPDRTFRYTEDGPDGLLSCLAYLVITSAGTPIDSEVDFATPYLRHVLGFMGIDEVTVIGCDGNWQDPDQRFQQALDQIDSLEL